MPPTTRGSISALLAPNLHKVYVETGKERPLEYTKFFNVSDMQWNPITDQQVSGLGTLQSKAENAQFTLDQIVIGATKTYTATAYGLAVEITWEAWRDELYGIMAEMVAELARASNYRQEVSAWSILNNSFSTSYVGFTAAESLCSTSHTSFADGTTRANRPSPDAALSQTAVQDMITRFESMTNERSLPQLSAPTRIVIDPTNKFAAREIFGSVGKAYSTDNEINALQDEDLAVFISHYITTSTYWWGAASPGIHDLNFFWRDRPIFDMFDDPWTKNAICTIYQRHTQGYGSWRHIDGSTG
jgi:hypothetical protein